jgi:formylglycine-generating enzyme required for sulfatase activity
VRVLAAAALAAIGMAQAAEPPPPGSEFRDCPACPAMIVIPTGQFDMFTPPLPAGRPVDEGYVRNVKIREPYALGKYEVTFDEWQACVRDKRCEPLDDSEFGRGRRPAIYVSWGEATAYAKWLSKKAGAKYRLPTEAEWEYAARAGAPATRYLGLQAAQVCEYGNVYDETGKAAHGYEWEHLPCTDGFAVTAPVGSLKPNAFGLYDMLGNVSEWLEDCVQGRWRGAPDDASAWPGGDCSERAFRGGSWLSQSPYYIRPMDRFKFTGARHNDLGFRVVRELP